ncbi:Glycosyltransferase, GT2 family [Fibrobacter sp. UWH9]|uniref:hypothetical protein n=1 Tax=unclassified Fibrobacter TaxID=2634177 RepID=UPI0009227F2E|nr:MULTISPECIES: hypothetical protein [Fibrobacter]MCL4102642.1 N-acetylglucosaminyl-diphospho-decaprenol L-rhamnosyltransferase [Fibrobacter succinogenes]OWV03724.1 hypothetical protein B7993_12670 [Fibrobacter sp. UWH3]SHG26972.1 Glycosyltransferase, GT2 family [Fibrobacter sp. UWH9]SHK39726.1 Glycosyltransferase, GT2 family [Fibrobacter sp. UWH6]
MLTFIFVDYKSGEATLNCIAHYIKKCKKSPAEISFVVVDNSVDDGNFVKLSSAYSTISITEYDGSVLEEKNVDGYRLLLWKNTSNAGYGKGNNAGAKIAGEFLGSDYLIFTNNDLLVLDDTLSVDTLITETEKPNVAIVGPSIVGKDGRPQNPYFEKNFFLRWGLDNLCYPLARFLPKKLTSGDLQENFVQNPVFRVMGAFFLIPRRIFEEVGCFDPNTFLFAEELILSRKLHDRGYVTHYVPAVHLLHNHSEIINKNYDFSKRLMLRFESESYYYKNYAGVSSVQIFVVRMILKSYIFRKKICKKIKSLFKKV